MKDGARFEVFVAGQWVSAKLVYGEYNNRQDQFYDFDLETPAPNGQMSVSCRTGRGYRKIEPCVMS